MNIFDHTPRHTQSLPSRMDSAINHDHFDIFPWTYITSITYPFNKDHWRLKTIDPSHCLFLIVYTALHCHSCSIRNVLRCTNLLCPGRDVAEKELTCTQQLVTQSMRLRVYTHPVTQGHSPSPRPPARPTTRLGLPFKCQQQPPPGTTTVLKKVRVQSPLSPSSADPWYRRGWGVCVGWRSGIVHPPVF